MIQVHEKMTKFVCVWYFFLLPQNLHASLLAFHFKLHESPFAFNKTSLQKECLEVTTNDLGS